MKESRIGTDRFKPVRCLVSTNDLIEAKEIMPASLWIAAGLLSIVLGLIFNPWHSDSLVPWFR